MLTFKTIFTILVAITSAVDSDIARQVWLKDNAEAKVFEVRNSKGGGGTGFAVEAPSGDVYIVTNSHVCESVVRENKSKNRVLVIQGSDERLLKILKLDENADLCLIEGFDGLEGFKLGDQLMVTDKVYSIGHPNLGPLTIHSGIVKAFIDVEIFHHYINGNDKILNLLFHATDETCNKPKNEIRRVSYNLLSRIAGATVFKCISKESRAVWTTLYVVPGSSGSPLVDRWGKVVGVVFANDRKTNDGFAVNLTHLKEFLNTF